MGRKEFTVLNDQQPIQIDRSKKTSQPDEVIKVPRKGMYIAGGGRGDLYVRVKVVFPDSPPASCVSAPEEFPVGAAELTAEEEMHVDNGQMYKAWNYKGAKGKKPKKKAAVKEEL